MALTFLQMQNEVTAYMNRSNASFVIGSVDTLKRAINKARKWAEMRRNFELCRLSVKIPSVSLTTGGLISSAVDNADGVTPINVKLLERAFLQFGADTIPVELTSRPYHLNRVQKRFENLVTTTQALATSQTVVYDTFSVVQQGGKVYVNPPNSAAYGGATSIPVFFDAVKWLPDYVGDSDTDFFLDVGTEFILYRSIYQLNLHLKEDSRIPLSKDALSDAWDSLIQWETSLVSNTVNDNSLD